ncbi:MAG: 2-phosphosulfolactate phosphatase, partial [Candidatus Brocadiaceae bacterium]|nr:2-phosphosulfolactate phosphatase [Candidatus Brocadiaceae bacterium]
LGGERGGLRIKGFQLGNSPLEYTREVVGGKDVLFTTTNCTKNLNTITRLGKPKEVLICSFLNLPAVADYLVGGKAVSESASGGSLSPTPYPLPPNDWVHLALSGTNGEVSLEDVVCGGMLIHRLVGAYSDTPLPDSARLAHVTYLHYKDNPRQALLDSTHGQRLIGLGMKRDVDFCGRVGIYDLVPRYSGGVIK